MLQYRIFLSSPIDVMVERDRAGLVIKRLNAERVDLPQLEIVRWEHEFYKAETDFQDQLPKPADCEMVVCIFWKRLGSELPERYARPDGTIPTGTEFEFESAMHAAAGRHEKLPDVLVYRKTAEITFAADKLEMERAQYECFMAFWQRWFRNEKGHFLAGFQTFQNPDDFERLLERHLRAWLQGREVHVAWAKGSPYRGLEPFDVEHAPIFFGRRREVERARARLVAAAMSGRPFLLVTGASGSGKSSLVRAGLIPRLGQVGGLSTLGAALRWSIVTPGQIAGNWAKGLAAALLEKGALGDELALGDFGSVEALAAQLSHADKSSPQPLVRALERAGEAIRVAEQRAEAPHVVHLLLIDQLEELFAWPKAQAQAFLELLRTLVEAPGSRLWLVATMRSDFQHRLAEYADLEQLVGRIEIKGPDEAERTMELALPTLADLREMIVQPARAAGLSFESSPDGRRDLEQLIEVEARPEAMPAIQFLLSELYTRRRGNMLTLEAFDQLLGVAGVMAQRGEEIYYHIDASARLAFPRVVRALVTQVRSDVPASARRISAKAFAEDRAATRLLAALNDARIVISDRGELRFAHDSVLQGWKRLKDQIGEEQRLFEARERLEQMCRRWVEGDRTTALLLQGFSLAEGRELLDKWGADGLRDKQPVLPEFIATSDAREKRLRRTTQAIGWSVAAVLALLSGQLYRLWNETDNARREAQVALWIANSRTELRDNRIVPAITNAASAFKERPSEISRSALAAALLELSPHLRVTIPIGQEAGGALAWDSPDSLVYATAQAGGQLRVLAPLQGRLAAEVAGLALPQLKREQDGNRASARVVRQLGADRMLAILDDATLAVIERGASPTRLVRPGKATTLFHTAHAAAIGRTGALSATASSDADVGLVECTPPSLADCRRRLLAGVRGRAVAVSPDETRIAVGDDAGSVSIHDRTGRRIGEAISIGGSLLSIGWSGTRDWLAVGTAEGEVTVIDVGAPARPVVGKTSLPGYPVTTLSWSPNSPDLAFACDGRVVCHWPLGGTSGATSNAPVRRYEGHATPVTRLAWSPAGDNIASIATDSTLRVWSLAQNAEAGSALYAETVAAHSTVASAPDGRLVAAGDKDGVVRIWDVATSAVVRREQLAAGTEIVALAWSRSGHLAAANESGRIAVIPADAAHPVRSLAIETTLNTRLAWGEDDRTLAIPQPQDKRIALIDTTGPELKVRGHLEPINAGATPWGVVVDPAGKTLVATYADAGGEIRVWDLATARSLGTMAYTLPQARDTTATGGLSITPDGRLLATAGGDSFVRIYDIPGRKSVRALAIEATEPHTVAFSPDGTRLAALGADNRLTVWRVRGDKFERYAVVVAIPTRAAVAEADRRHERARWLTWVGNDSVAVATETSAITIVGLDPAGWQRRMQGLSIEGVARAETERNSRNSK